MSDASSSPSWSPVRTSLAFLAIASWLLVGGAHAQSRSAVDPPGGPIAERMVPGAVLELPAGRFRLEGTSVVEGDLTLRGAGRDATVLVAAGGEAVHVRSGALTLENLTIVAPGDDPNNLVYLQQATFAVRDVRLESADATPGEEGGELGPGGIGVYATGSSGVIERTQLVDNEKYGVYADAGSDVTVRDVTVEGGLYGVRVSGEGAGATIARTVVQDVAGDGFYVGGSSVVTLDEVTVLRAGEAGILIVGEADVTVTRSTIEDSGEGGLATTGTGTVRIESVTSRGNGFSGILVEAGAPTIVDVTVLDNEQGGMAFFNDARGTVDGVEARGNVIAGIAFLGSSAPSLTDVIASDNGGYGLRLDEGTAPTFGPGLVLSGNGDGPANRDDLAERAEAEAAAAGPSESEPLDDLLAAGGEVRLPAGTFFVDFDVVPESDLRLIGAGRDATTIRFPYVMFSGIAADGVDVTVQDVTLLLDAPAGVFGTAEVLSVTDAALVVRDAIVRNEAEHEVEVSGVAVFSGTLSADGLRVEGFPFAGIDVQGGIANLREVTATGNRNGVRVDGLDGAAIAELRDAELLGNELAGVAVFADGSARIQGGRVAENGSEAVYVATGGSASLDGVDVEDHAQYGLFADGGRITAVEVTLARNRNAVWAVLDSNVTLERSDILDDLGFGVAGNGSGTTTLRDVTIAGPALSAIIAEERRALDLERVTVRGAGETGLFLVGESSAEASASRFESNGVNGVETRDAARLTLLDVDLVGNGRNGANLAASEPARLEAVRYDANALGPLREEAGATAGAATTEAPSRSDGPSRSPDTDGDGPPPASTGDAGPVAWTIDDSSGEPFAFATGPDAGVGLGCDDDGVPFAALFVFGGPAADRSDYQVDDGGEAIDLSRIDAGAYELSIGGSRFAAAEDLIFTARFQDVVTLTARLDGEEVTLLAYRGGEPFRQILAQLPCMP